MRRTHKSTIFMLLVLATYLVCHVTCRSQEPIHALKHGGRITNLSVSSGGNLLAVGYSRNDDTVGSIILRKAKTGNQIRQLKDHEQSIVGMGFVDNDKYLISAGFSNTIRVTKVINGDTVAETGQLATLTRMSSLELANMVATYEGELRLWNFKSPDHLSRAKNDINFGSCSRFTFSADAKLLAKATNESLTDFPPDTAPRLEVWDVKSGKMLHKHLGQEKNNVTRLEISPNNEFLAIGYFFGPSHLEVRHITNGKLLFSGAAQDYPVHAMAFAPNTKHLVTGSAVTGEIIVWDLNKKSYKASVVGAHRGSVSCLAFTPDGGHLLSGGTDGFVKIWNFVDLLKSSDR